MLQDRKASVCKETKFKGRIPDARAYHPRMEWSIQEYIQEERMMRLP